MGEQVPAVEGWFTGGDGSGGEPALLAQACTTCGTRVFPQAAITCPNPACDGSDFDRVELSRRGTVWSYSTNHYQPPEPYIAPDPFVPYTVVAVELLEEKMVVLGQLDGDPSGMRVGDEMVLTTGVLYERDGVAHTVWKWRRAESALSAEVIA